MTFEVFMVLLTAFSIITSLFVEATKKLLDSSKVNYASNLLVLCIAVLVGGFGTAFLYVWKDLAWTATNIISIFLMICANWLVSMLGYDKVIQAITQLKGGQK
jgi:hypothetical protein